MTSGDYSPRFTIFRLGKRPDYVSKFVQDNHSLSTNVSIIRGLHFQTAPAAQDKLVRVVRGRILDVAVDFPRSSPTFGRCDALWSFPPTTGGSCSCQLASRTDSAFWSPIRKSFAKVPGRSAGASDFGLAFDDPDLNIDWPVSPADALLSDKDRRWPRLRHLAQTFG